MDNACLCTGCIHNRDGQCLDKKLLSDPYKQTGCLRPETVLKREVEK